jgi:hypothetical protein
MNLQIQHTKYLPMNSQRGKGTTIYIPKYKHRSRPGNQHNNIRSYFLDGDILCSNKFMRYVDLNYVVNDRHSKKRTRVAIRLSLYSLKFAHPKTKRI